MDEGWNESRHDGPFFPSDFLSGFGCGHAWVLLLVAFGAEGYAVALVIIVHGGDVLENCFGFPVEVPYASDDLIEVDYVMDLQVLRRVAAQATVGSVPFDPSVVGHG